MLEPSSAQQEFDPTSWSIVYKRHPSLRSLLPLMDQKRCQRGQIDVLEVTPSPVAAVTGFISASQSWR